MKIESVVTANTPACSQRAWVKNVKHLTAAIAIALLGGPTHANADLLEDFDGGGNTPYAVTSSSGDFTPMVMAGGPSGSFLRLTDLSGSNNNSVAFDENVSVTGPAPLGKILSFDFRISDNQANADAGGCCGSAADGFGIGYFGTPIYGATGPINPAEGDVNWERPSFPGGGMLGFDVFENIDVVTLNLFGAQVAEVDVQPIMDLNNNVFHRAELIALPDPADANKSVFDVIITEDFYGESPTEHVIMSVPTEINLNNLPMNRVIAGGRTGGAFASIDIDNVHVFLVPEPNSIGLLMMATLGLLKLRRRS